MNSFGKQELGKIRVINSISASPSPENLRGGAIDWKTVRPTTSKTMLIDETTIEDGDKFLRYGAVLVRIDRSR
jgi:hypothetical protein